MSGGAFDYIQYRVRDAVDTIAEEIHDNEKPPVENPDNEWDKYINDEFFANGGKRYTDETIAEFKNGIEAIEKAVVYMQRIDWLLSGDDSEESFHQRLKEDLAELDERLKKKNYS